jgi:MFS family permease
MSGNANFWRSTVLLIIAGLGSSLPVAAVAPAMSVMAPVLGEGPRGVFLVQLAMTIPGLAMLLTAPLIGWLSERVGYRYMVLVGLAAFIATGVVGGILVSPAIHIASRFLLGVAAAAMMTPTYALVSYYFDDKTRDRMLGLMAAASAVVGITIALIAGFLVKTMGWQSPYTLFALGIVPLVMALPIITDKQGNRTAIKPAPSAGGEKVPFPAVAGIFALTVWLSLLSFNATVQGPFLLAERGLTDPSLISVLISVISGTIMVVSPFYGRLAAVFNARLMMALIIASFAIGHLLMGFSPGLPLIIAGTVMFGIGSALVQPTCGSYLFNVLPPSAHGRAMGGLIGCLFLGQFVNPFVLAPVNAMFGIAPTFVLMGALNIALALLFVAAPLFLRSAPAKG